MTVNPSTHIIIWTYVIKMVCLYYPYVMEYPCLLPFYIILFIFHYSKLIYNGNENRY